MMIFNFDDINGWGPMLSAHVSSLLSLPTLTNIIRAEKPEYLEDAAEIFFSKVFTDRVMFYSAVTTWLKEQTIAAYHGTRLDEDGVSSIAHKGLIRLSGLSRREGLRKKLSGHPRWSEDEFDEMLQQIGAEQVWGNREGQVHATISRAGLENGFNHYLTYGSEFDQCVVSMLFGEDEKELLKEHGRPILVTLAVPGEEAIAAANPFRINPDHNPMVRQIIQVWAHWLFAPTFLISSLRFDCGLIFFRDVPPSWIHLMDTLAEI